MYIPATAVASSVLISSVFPSSPTLRCASATTSAEDDFEENTIGDADREE
jgi:hypothetical protein